MKTFTKFKAVLGMALALAMCVSLSVPAFAAENDDDAAYTYDVFQIFTGEYADSKTDMSGAGDLDGKTLSSLRYGQNAMAVSKGTAAERELLDTEALNALLATMGKHVNQETGEGQAVAWDITNRAKLEDILPWVDLDSTPYLENKTLSEATRTALPNGYYLVRVNASSVDEAGEAFDIYATQVVNQYLDIQPKYDAGTGDKIPTIDKTIDTDKKKDSSAIGDTVTFTLTSTLPANLHDYYTYFFLVEDTLSDGLTWNGRASVKSVTIDGQDVTSETFVSDKKDDAGKVYMGFQNILATGVAEDNSKVVITYEVVVNDDAVVATDANTNDVRIQYSSNPNFKPDGDVKNDPDDKPTPDPDEPTNKTVEGENTHTETWITGLTVELFNKRGTALTGSTFELTGENLHTVIKYTSNFVVDNENGTYYKLRNGAYTNVAPTDETRSQYDNTDTNMYRREDTLKTVDENGIKVSATIDENGQLSIAGLKAGTYTLKNTSISNGYELQDDVTFTISFADNQSENYDSNYTNELFTSDNDQVQERTPEWFYITMYADAGTLLPETGGMGVYLLYGVGAVLVIAALAVVVIKRRKDAAAE